MSKEITKKRTACIANIIGKIDLMVESTGSLNLDTIKTICRTTGIYDSEFGYRQSRDMEKYIHDYVQILHCHKGISMYGKPWRLLEELDFNLSNINCMEQSTRYVAFHPSAIKGNISNRR